MNASLNSRSLYWVAIVVYCTVFYYRMLVLVKSTIFRSPLKPGAQLPWVLIIQDKGEEDVLSNPCCLGTWKSYHIEKFGKHFLKRSLPKPLHAMCILQLKWANIKTRVSIDTCMLILRTWYCVSTASTVAIYWMYYCIILHRSMLILRTYCAWLLELQISWPLPALMVR